MSPHLRLPRIFSDHLVLQSDRENPIWGKAGAGAEVSVIWQGRKGSTRADASGKWLFRLVATAAGGPHTIEISCGTEKLTLNDVLVGEVWLCSGQSNMEWSVAMSNDAENEIASAQYPLIRLLKIPKVALADPHDDVDASWQICSPETVRDFSAVAYYFGRDLYQSRNVPIGLVDSSWGGSNAETWVEQGDLQGEPAFESFLAPYKYSCNETPESRARKKEVLEQWAKVERWKDPGNRGYFMDWAEPGFDDSGWSSYRAPGFWQNQGMPFNGAVWFRKQIDVPQEWAGRDLMVSVGRLDDFDDAYFNGIHVGTTGNDTPNWWLTPRYYKIPARLFVPGKPNTIALRIFDDYGNGGFGGGAPMALYPDGSKPEDGIPLDGEWKCHVELALTATFPERVRILAVDSGPNAFNSPSNLYNGMIAPLVPFGFKGVIWYQGESNGDRGAQYKILFPRLIESWRKHFQNPELGFFFVLLANFGGRQTEPVETTWTEIREAQLEALRLPLTGHASAIDIGDADDIHPTDKQSVGHRLALSARAILYGEKLEHSGPVFEQATPDGPSLRLRFENARGLKTRDGGPLVGFAVRSDKGGWAWAAAKIDHKDVVLTHPAKEPIAHVRYAWAGNPIGNLANAAGLPAAPFRTDK